MSKINEKSRKKRFALREGGRKKFYTWLERNSKNGVIHVAMDKLDELAQKFGTRRGNLFGLFPGLERHGLIKSYQVRRNDGIIVQFFPTAQGKKSPDEAPGDGEPVKEANPDFGNRTIGEVLSTLQKEREKEVAEFSALERKHRERLTAIDLSVAMIKKAAQT